MISVSIEREYWPEMGLKQTWYQTDTLIMSC